MESERGPVDEAAAQKIDLEDAGRELDPHGPLAMGGDPRGFQVHGHAALEHEVGLGLVGMGPFGDPPARRDLDGRLAGQGQGQVDVVDHQVEHARNVRAAARPGPAPDRLDPDRPLGQIQEAYSAKYRPLLVATGQHRTGRLGRLNQRPRLLGVVGQGLFDIDVLALGQGGGRQARMGRGRRGHRDQVNGVQEGLQLVEDDGAGRAGQGLGALLVRIQHGRQRHARQAGVLARMVAAEHAGADHARSQGTRHRDSLFRGCVIGCVDGSGKAWALHFMSPFVAAPLGLRLRLKRAGPIPGAPLASPVRCLCDRPLERRLQGVRGRGLRRDRAGEA